MNTIFTSWSTGQQQRLDKGNRLQTVEEVLFYKPGIECIAIAGQIHRHFRSTRAYRRSKAIELDFKISPDAELRYFLRLRTQEKVSEMLSFWVTFNVVHELSPYRDNDKQRNNTPETAQKIELNTTVSGMYTSDDYANDIDLYRIYLDKGQRVSVQLLNARLGTHHYGLTDMHIEVTSPSGKQVARNSRTALFGHDPFLTFMPRIREITSSRFVSRWTWKPLIFITRCMLLIFPARSQLSLVDNLV